MTIGELLTRNANKFPDKPAVVYEGDVSMTFRAFYWCMNRLARRFLV
ncbi:MAG: hypothetical protein ABSC19_16705 [Syntrophorhabdales bacterium]|jgi:acyl-CoA synthetase (AMP-forming)/AMP-acid ligase II